MKKLIKNNYFSVTLRALIAISQIPSFLATPLHADQQITDVTLFHPGKNQYKEYFADYKNNATQEKMRLEVNRQFKFKFLNAAINTTQSRNNNILQADPNAMLREYLPDGRSRQVDCRIVAKDMVLTLIDYRVNAKINRKSKDGETRDFSFRSDVLDKALIAKQLNDIFIKVGEPGYVCMASSVKSLTDQSQKNDTAKCGRLTIQTQPQVLTSGIHKGEKAIVFNPDVCKWFSETMKFSACEKIALIEGCGLRYILKANKTDLKNKYWKGLSDVLEENLAAELDALLLKRPVVQSKEEETSFENSNDDMPEDFYNNFTSSSVK